MAIQGTTEMQGRRNAKRQRQYRIVLDLLVSKYPKAFFPKDSRDTRPLKIGVIDDLVAAELGLSRMRIAQFLKAYTHKDRYQRALLDCVYRVDLDGKPTHPVTESAKVHALSELQKKQQKLMENRRRQKAQPEARA